MNLKNICFKNNGYKIKMSFVNINNMINSIKNKKPNFINITNMQQNWKMLKHFKNLCYSASFWCRFMG
jgi:hypothetical protein